MDVDVFHANYSAAKINFTNVINFKNVVLTFKPLTFLFFWQNMHITT